MSKAHYFVRDFTRHQIIDLISYETRFPAKLTTTQKITRMYLSLLRIGHTQFFLETSERFKDYERQVARWRVEFEDLLEQDRDIEHVNRQLARYQDWHWDNFDPQLFIRENRPYAPTSGRFRIYDDHELAVDALGYYSEKNAVEAEAYYGFPLLADYPVEEYYVNLSDEMAPVPEGPTEAQLFSARDL
jgi:hypothetical protein